MRRMDCLPSGLNGIICALGNWDCVAGIPYLGLAI